MKHWLRGDLSGLIRWLREIDERCSEGTITEMREGLNGNENERSYGKSTDSVRK